MKYHLYAYITEPSSEEIYSANKSFNTLNEALYYYDQYNGIEVLNFYDYRNTGADFVFCIGIYKVDNEKDIFEMVKEKYKPLYLKDLYSDFWDIFNIIKNM